MATYNVSQFSRQGDRLVGKASELGMKEGQQVPEVISIVFPRIGTFAYEMRSAVIGSETPNFEDGQLLYVSYDPVLEREHQPSVMILVE